VVVLVAVVALWGAVVLLVNSAMHRSPEEFGRFMTKVPGPAFLILPFETLWTRARAGAVNVGDEAPDFTLASLDKSSHVQLSSFRGKQPVVLVFGSYT
jgi:hypothetical protein